jgi:hypothetical protein
MPVTKSFIKQHKMEDMEEPCFSENLNTSTTSNTTLEQTSKKTSSSISEKIVSRFSFWKKHFAMFCHWF